MFAGHRPTSPNKLLLSHALLSLIVLLVCFAYIIQYNDLENLGHLFMSPIVWILIAGELFRLVANQSIHHLEVYLKDSIKPKGSAGYRILATVVQSIILLVMSTIAYAFVCVLFGAPALRSYEQTFTLAVLLTALTILPTCLYVGPYATVQYLFSDTFKLATKSEMVYLEFIRRNAVGTILGAWFGSIVVPLDWDQYWQRYPIPNVCGAMIGFGVANGHAITGVLYEEITNGLAKTKRH